VVVDNEGAPRASAIGENVEKPAIGDTIGENVHESVGRPLATPGGPHASHPVYATIFNLDENHWAQLVFQCRVRPGGLVEKPGSLRNKHWPNHVRIDANFPSLSGLEWLVYTSFLSLGEG
jgi:hypothetical protein